VKPILQVIDDSGTFRGWVGVEASFWPNGGPNPRASDLLSVGELAAGVPDAGTVSVRRSGAMPRYCLSR
jgi:hypothetical protein